MKRRSKNISVLVLSILAIAASVRAQTDRPVAPPAVKTPPPAFAADMPVVDRNGLQVGRIKSLAESARGTMVVVQIDGKLVSVPQSTLTLTSGTARSSQTKADMLAAAGAPG